MVVIIDLLNITIAAILPIILLSAYSKIDTDLIYNIKTNKISSIIIVTIGICTILLKNVLISAKSINGSDINIMVSVIVAYLIFESYSDIKTGMVYTTPSIILILTNIVAEMFKATHNYRDIVYIAIMIVLLYMISKLKLIGLGDVYIYTVLFTYVIYRSSEPFFWSAYIVGVSNMLFIIVIILSNVCKKLFRNSKKLDKAPFTAYIAISAIPIMILL